MADVYGFDKATSRELVRELFAVQRKVDVLSDNLRKQSVYLARGQTTGALTYCFPKTTLEPSSSCEAYLASYSDADEDFIKNTRDTVTVYDYNSWAFGVGSDDYSSTTHRLPVAQHPLSKTYVVVAPVNLIQRAKPDSTIATGSTGTVSIYAGDTDTTVNVTARVKWGDNGEGWTSGKEGWIRWNLEAAEWEWVGGDCE